MAEKDVWCECYACVNQIRQENADLRAALAEAQQLAKWGVQSYAKMVEQVKHLEAALAAEEEAHRIRTDELEASQTELLETRAALAETTAERSLMTDVANMQRKRANKAVAALAASEELKEGALNRVVTIRLERDTAQRQLTASEASQRALRETLLDGDDRYLFPSLKLALDWMDEHLRDDAFECDCNGSMDYEVNAFEHGDNCSAFMDQHIELTRQSMARYAAKRTALLAATAAPPAAAADEATP